MIVFLILLSLGLGGLCIQPYSPILVLLVAVWAFKKKMRRTAIGLVLTYVFCVVQFLFGLAISVYLECADRSIYTFDEVGLNVKVENEVNKDITLSFSHNEDFEDNSLSVKYVCGNEIIDLVDKYVQLVYIPPSDIYISQEYLSEYGDTTHHIATKDFQVHVYEDWAIDTEWGKIPGSRKKFLEHIYLEEAPAPQTAILYVYNEYGDTYFYKPGNIEPIKYTKADLKPEFHDRAIDITLYIIWGLVSALVLVCGVLWYFRRKALFCFFVVYTVICMLIEVVIIIEI